jgi:glyoxylase-like metal-dependent hydrolase (beta-lactamase superfamily II)
MTTISPTRLADRLRSDRPPVLLDIRSAEEFEDWHIPGSINIDVYDELREDEEGAVEALQDLPPDEEIVTICGIGIASRTATDLLRDHGYEAMTLVDGLLGWSQVHRTAEISVDLPGTLIQVARPGKGCLSYVLISADRAAVIDPSQYVEEYEAVIADFDAELVGVFETHAHADHLSGAADLAERHDVPYHLHSDDAVAVDAVPISEGDSFTIGEVTLTAIHTPGHSPGGVTYDLAGTALVTGDTLFHASVGRVELGATVGLDDADVERNAERLYESLQRLVDYPDNPLILPAHDPGSPDPPVTDRLEAVIERNRDLGLDRSTFIERLTSDRPDLPPNVRQIKRANVGLESIDDTERTSIELGPNRCAAE